MVILTKRVITGQGLKIREGDQGRLVQTGSNNIEVGPTAEEDHLNEEESVVTATAATRTRAESVVTATEATRAETAMTKAENAVIGARTEDSGRKTKTDAEIERQNGWSNKQVSKTQYNIICDL
mgnify:FL=1